MHAQIQKLDRSNNNMFKNDSTQFSNEVEFKFELLELELLFLLTIYYYKRKMRNKKNLILF